MGGKASSKALIANCRSDAKAKGLRGDELKSAVDECVGAQKPKLAARLQCRQQGKAQGLAGDDLKAFVKTCVAQGPGQGGQNMAAGRSGPAAGGRRRSGATFAGGPKPKSAARVQCRQQGKAQGLAGDDLKAFIKTCVDQGPQAAGQPMPGPGDQGGPATPAGADQGPPPGAAADQGPPPGGAMGGKTSSKELVADCRGQGQGRAAWRATH